MMLMAATPLDGEDLDACLRDVASAASGLGYRAAGSVRIDQPDAAAHPCDMVWRDLVSGRTLSLALERGPGATGCRLDQSVIEDAAGLAGAALDAGADLLILPRFGKQEAAGQGLRSVIARAAAHGIPVVVGVSRGHREAWREFAGDVGVETSADPTLIVQALTRMTAPV
jgi:hypothetical protein